MTSRAAGAVRTLALVESPAQLLNVVEWAHATQVDRRELTIAVLAPTDAMTRRQLRRMAQLATAADHRLCWHEPRQGGAAGSVRVFAGLAVALRGVERLVVGDPFSGAIQLVLGLSGAREVVVVDDGTATLEFARLWSAGETLVRWHSGPLSGHRRQLAAIARRRMQPGSGCAVTLFTCMPVQLAGATVLHNTFSWIRSTFAAPATKAGGDLVGTSLVETGVVDAEHYLAGVETLAREHALDRYFAHRKEDGQKLARIAALGLKVVRPDLPLELVARRTPVGRALVSFPSTVVHTLPLVLSDTDARLHVCDIAEDWYTREAPVHSDRFLGQVTTTARDTHGLLSVAC